MIGDYIVKEATSLSLNDPMLRVALGTGLGTLVGSSASYVAPEMPYLSEEDRKKRRLIGMLEGALYGGGLGLVSTLLPNIKGV